MNKNYATAPMHRWIGGHTPDFFRDEAHVYQPKEGFSYQTDYTYNEHFSILDAESVQSLVEQVRNGQAIYAVCFHHFTDRDCDAVQFLLRNGQLDYQCRRVVQYLTFAAYNHLNHYGNREIALAILVSLMAYGYSVSELWLELDYYHGYEGFHPEYRVEFDGFLRTATIACNAQQLAQSLKTKRSTQQQRPVKI